MFNIPRVALGKGFTATSNVDGVDRKLIVDSKMLFEADLSTGMPKMPATTNKGNYTSMQRQLLEASKKKQGEKGKKASQGKEGLKTKQGAEAEGKKGKKASQGKEGMKTKQGMKATEAGMEC